jgi:hypothetical protein
VEWAAWIIDRRSFLNDRSRSETRTKSGPGLFLSPRRFAGAVNHSDASPAILARSRIALPAEIASGSMMPRGADPCPIEIAGEFPQARVARRLLDG